MVIAMPAVKPTTTACGIRRTQVPTRSRPATAISTPAMMVAISIPSHTVPRDGGRNQHDERTGRTADLEAAAAQRGDQEAPDYGGEQAALRTHARSDGDGHRQRQRDDGHGDRGEQIMAQLPGLVALAQHHDELGLEGFGFCGKIVRSWVGRQRNELRLARHWREAAFPPVRLRLFDALAAAGDEVPPDEARAVGVFHRPAACSVPASTARIVAT